MSRLGHFNLGTFAWGVLAHLVFRLLLRFWVKLSIHLRLYCEKFIFIVLNSHSLQNTKRVLKLLLKVQHLVKKLLAVGNVVATLLGHQFVDAVLAHYVVLGKEVLHRFKFSRICNEVSLLQLCQVFLALLGGVAHALHIFLQFGCPVLVAVLC